MHRLVILRLVAIVILALAMWPMGSAYAQQQAYCGALTHSQWQDGRDPTG